MSQIIINISNPNDGLGEKLRTAFGQVNTMFTELYIKSVFKEAGKGLSSNDFTTENFDKLAGIAAGAEVNVQADLLQADELSDDFVKGKEIFANVIIKSKRFTPTGQTCTLPTDATAIEAYIDGYIQYLEQTGFETDLNTFTQTGDVVTFKQTLETGTQIIIKYNT